MCDMRTAMTSLRMLLLAIVVSATACVKSGQAVERPTAPQRTFDPATLCNSRETQNLCTPIVEQPVLIDTNVTAHAASTPALG